MPFAALLQSRPARPALHLLKRLVRASALARSRRPLARLDDHLLRDIGLTRAEAEAEALRPAWDAPRHWRS
jgi:uncharacterized protein YjiS (DUF1127 family)